MIALTVSEKRPVIEWHFSKTSNFQWRRRWFNLMIENIRYGQKIATRIIVYFKMDSATAGRYKENDEMCMTQLSLVG